MKLWRFLKVMFSLTILALIYIHMQMNIFSLAYEGKQKENQIVRLKEHNGRVENNIFELKSASYLGQRLLSKDGRLKFCNKKNVVNLAKNKDVSQKDKLASSKKGKIHPLFKFLTLRVKEAQAKEQKVAKPWARR